jgi:diaminopimelate decarboxylase
MNERQSLLINDNNHLQIGGVDCESLVKTYGTPLYVMDQAHVENMCKAFNSAFESEGVKGKVIYASKAFCCKETYRLLKSLNVCADVVSGGEFYTALSVDFPAENLVFHGNNKTICELDFALSNNIGFVVIDSLQEAYNLQKLCEAKGRNQKVLIRINPGVEAHTHHYIQTAKIDSKFGFSIFNGDANEIIDLVLGLKNLSLVGLHCHIGSQYLMIPHFYLQLIKCLIFITN